MISRSLRPAPWHTRTVSVLVSVVAAAQDVNVKIVDDGRGGLGLRELLLPGGAIIGALIAGVGGVLLGGKIQDRIEDKRGEREDRLDERRADRERVLEDERQARTDHAAKRQAIGAARAAIGEFEGARIPMKVTITFGRWWPGKVAPKPGLTPEQVHLLATWLSHGGWLSFYVTRLQLALVVDSPRGDPTTATRTERLRLLETVELLADAVTNLRREIERMTREIGDSSELKWVPMLGEVDPAVVAQLRSEAEPDPDE